MKIAITGGTGFVGSHLIPHLIQKNHQVLLISRTSASSKSNIQSVKTITWDQLGINPELFEDVDAVVNLAGESINQRWTEAAKARILNSRLKAADQISKAIEQCTHKPKVVVNASGMSIYGTSETDTFDERSPERIVDFLSGVVKQWEQAADQIEGTRLVKVRVGLVVGTDGGAFPPMSMPYKLGIGGKVGSGKQWLSWIHIKDMVRLIEFCIVHEAIEGPVNATAPNPVTNEQFGQAIGRAFHRPHWFPVPSFMLKLIFGELSTLLLDGQKVLPHVLVQHGFEFQFLTVDQALEDLAKH
ncbi:Epimerase family protein [compost metagenome]